MGKEDGGEARLQALWDVIVPALGFALFWPLHRPSSFKPIIAGSVDNEVIRWSFTMVLVFEAILIFTAVMLRRRLPIAAWVQGRTLVLTSSLLGTATSACIFAFLSAEGWRTPLLDLALLLLAASHVVLALAWGCRLSRMRSARAVFVIALAGAISSALYALFYFYKGVGTAIALASPLVSGVLLCAPGAFPRTDEHQKEAADVLTQLRKLPLAIVVVSAVTILALTLVARVVSNSTDDIPVYERMLTQYGLVVLLSAQAVFLYLNDFSRKTMHALFVLQVLIGLFGLLLVIMLSGSEGLPYAAGIVTLGTRSLEIFFLMVLAYSVVEEKLSPVLIFGLGIFFAFCLPSFMGYSVFDRANILASLSSRVSFVSVAAVVSFAIFVMTTLVLNFSRFAEERKLATMATGADQGEPHVLESRNNLSRQACERAAQGLNLTARELDVMRLFYQGLSVSRTASALNIASTTVQGYSRSLYQKLGIHSKQELIEFVNERGARP